MDSLNYPVKLLKNIGNKSWIVSGNNFDIIFFMDRDIGHTKNSFIFLNRITRFWQRLDISDKKVSKLS